MKNPTLDIDAVRTAIDTSVTATLEGMLFMEAIAAEGPGAPANGVWARVEASSPVPCRVTFQADAGLAARLASELHLSDSPAAETVVRDTIGELVNTIAGAALGTMDEELAIVMGLPETGTGAVEFVEDVVQHRYKVDEDELVISIELRPEVMLTSA